MPFLPQDWTIDRTTRDIRYIGDSHTGANPSYARVIEFHRALQQFAYDGVSSGDDELSIIDQTPSDRGGVDTNITLLNGYNITDTEKEHLYDGSITQANGDEVFDGIQVFGNANTVQIIQNGARLVNDFWNSPNMVAATSDAVSGTSHRFLVQVRTAGADIDGRRLIGTQREWGTQYTEFRIGGGTNRGNNTLALTANPDLNNQTAEGTVAGFTDIVISPGYSAIDADGNGTDEFYFTNIDLGPRSKNDLYERGKYIQREGTAEIIFGIPGDTFRGVTHQFDYDGLTSNFSTAETVSWPNGSAVVLADDGVGTMWIQLLTGLAPSDNDLLTGGTSGATANVDGVALEKATSATFVGASTGSAIIGAFGIGISAGNLTKDDLLIDLTAAPRTPPNNVQFTVTGLVAGEDRVLVTEDDPNNSGNIHFDQLSLANTETAAATTSIQMSAAIPTDTPVSGSIYVQINNGNYIPVAYSAFSGDTFTVASTDFSTQNATAGNNAFIAYINEIASAATASFTVVFSGNRTMFTRIRDGGTAGDLIPTKTFEQTSLLSAAGGGIGNNRTPD